VLLARGVRERGADEVRPGGAEREREHRGGVGGEALGEVAVEHDDGPGREGRVRGQVGGGGLCGHRGER